MRLPAVAGRFYPADADSLENEILDCFNHPIGPGLPKLVDDERSILSAIAPHAGYRASGMNAAHLYKAIKEDGLPEAYVVIGPDHVGIPYNAVLCSEPYLTPFGECPVHTEIAEGLSASVPDDPSAHAFEHSIEVHVPFIQFIDPSAKLVPIIMRDQTQKAAERLCKDIERVCDGIDAVVIASSDLSHYIGKNDATRIDAEFLNAAERMDVDGMYDAVKRNRMSACGYGPSAVAVSYSNSVSKGNRSAELLRYSDSYDSLGGNMDQVVGYASMAFRRNP